MREAEWSDCRTDTLAMLAFLTGREGVSQRKLRLFAVACSRLAWGSIDVLGRAAVEMAEGFADGLVGPQEMRAARLACKGAGSQAAWYAAATRPDVAARNAALSTRALVDPGTQADVLRDLFGPLPFRPVPLDPSWLAWNGCTVTRLAESAYEEREMPEGALDNARLAVLADALEEAGCEQEEILSHLRQQGAVHVRGCWPLDLVLGKP